MADTKVSALAELAAPDAADLLYVVDDPGGTPASKKATIQNVVKCVKLDDLAAPDDNTDLNVSNTAHGLAPKVTTAGYAAVVRSNTLAYEQQVSTINYRIENGSSDLATGYKGHVKVDFAGVILAAGFDGDQSASIVVDVWAKTSIPLADGDSITAAAPITVASAQGVEDTTLTGWTKTFAAGTRFGFNVDSCTGMHGGTIWLKVARS